jgi:hypothetical protein
LREIGQQEKEGQEKARNMFLLSSSNILQFEAPRMPKCCALGYFFPEPQHLLSLWARIEGKIPLWMLEPL